MIYKFVTFLLAAFTLVMATTHAAEVVFNSGFEMESAGETPRGWKAFPQGARPSVKVVKSKTHQRLRGERSESGGLTALSREFDSQQRVMIEFSFAFSTTSGRSLNVWTHCVPFKVPQRIKHGVWSEQDESYAGAALIGDD